MSFDGIENPDKHQSAHRHVREGRRVTRFFPQRCVCIGRCRETGYCAVAKQPVVVDSKLLIQARARDAIRRFREAFYGWEQSLSRFS